MTELPRLVELLALPVDQRLALAEALWDSLTSVPDAIPIPDWHRQLLDDRLAEDDSDGEEGLSFDNLRQQIEQGR